MLRIAIILTSLLFSSVSAQTYLPLADLPTAQARTQAECVRRGCDGVLTKYWWNVILHPSNSTVAVVVELNGPFADAGLTAGERIAIRTRLQAIALGWLSKLNTGTSVNGSATVTGLDTTQLSVGLVVTTQAGTSRGIPANTTIAAIPSATTITLSANCVNGGTIPTNCGVTAFKFDPLQ